MVFGGDCWASWSIDDPFQDADVLTEARPQEMALCVAPEPVHIEHARRVRQLPPEGQPVVEVTGHVVAGERQHPERVAAHLAAPALRCRRRPRTPPFPRVAPLNP